MKQTKPLGNGKVEHEFHTTAKLSTYLIAYCIGNFDTKSTVIKNKDGSDLKIEVVAPKGNESKMDMPLHVILSINIKV